MKTLKTDLTQKAEVYAREMLSGFSKDFHYHDLKHTVNVAEAAYRIGVQSGVSKDDLENIVVAAWFHDLGYQEGAKDHEEESVRIMRHKLQEWETNQDKINEIERLILATKMPHSPTDILTRIMCDADLYHLCQPDFQKRSEKLRKEINCTCSKNIQPAEWIRMNVEFLMKHNYFTEYGKKVLAPLKKKTLTQIRHRLGS